MKKKIIERILIVILLIIVGVLETVYYNVQKKIIESEFEIIETFSDEEKIENMISKIKEDLEVNEDEIYYPYVSLRINMPTNLTDLEKNFEIPMQEYMDEKNLGMIIGDGFAIDEEGIPYAADIEFEIPESNLEGLKNMLSSYKLPKGSYLEVDGEIVEEYEDLEVVELKVDDLSKNKASKVYNGLKEKMKGEYEYSYVYDYEFGKIEKIYFCGENLEKMQEIIDKYIKENKIKNVE